MKATLRIAAAQFPVSSNMGRNARYIESLTTDAARSGADIILFPETALPGYKVSLDDAGWGMLHEHEAELFELASSQKIWIVLGSMRQVGRGLPRNCLHVISDTGQLAGSYDKRRLYRQEKDLYTPGTGPLVVDINGHKCGFLICYDNCFPELYHAYRERKVRVLFHSFYNAGNSKASSIANLMSGILIARAADNQMWIAASNSSRRYSPLRASVTRPDGSVVKAQRSTGLVIDEYPTAQLGWTYDNTLSP